MISFGRLVVSAFVAPATAALVFCIGGALFQPEVVGVEDLWTVALYVFIAVLFGLAPALTFGSAGAALAERWLSDTPLWGWGLAGGATTLAYVLVALLVGMVWPEGVFWFAPWAMGAGGGTGGVVAAILAGGVVGGVTYRALPSIRRRQSLGG